jgi:hypothetical protein
MLGVSLIITILTQIVASFLGLRGTNVLWGIETLLAEQPQTQAAEVPVSTSMPDHPHLSRLGTVPASTITVSGAVSWLTRQPGAAGAGPLYRRSVITVLRAHAVEINQKLVSSGIELVPDPYPGLITYSGWHNFFGILTAAGLLSLGAPFWFNILKNLSNLRTVVASRQEQPRQAA